jgi:hypothetical protein
MMRSVGIDPRTREQVEEKDNFNGRRRLREVKEAHRMHVFEQIRSMDNRSIVSENDEL